VTQVLSQGWNPKFEVIPKDEVRENLPTTRGSKKELTVLDKEQGDYTSEEPRLLEALEGRRLKLGDTQPHTLESWKNLIDLYEAWGKAEEANQWRAKLPES
jgi:hypothetical protein